MSMKCLVYGIYFLEFVQSALTIDNGFRTFVTSFGDVQALDRVGTAWFSIPILTAICEFSYPWASRPNIPARYILCPGILCTSDQYFGKIEEGRSRNYHCKLLEEFLLSPKSEHYQKKNAWHKALFHSTRWWDSDWSLSKREEILQLDKHTRNDGPPEH